MPVGDLVLFQSSASGPTTTTALHANSGQLRWSIEGAVVKAGGIDELFVVQEGPRQLDVLKISVDSGATTGKATIPTDGLARPILVDGKVLLLDGERARLIDGYTGRGIWEVPSTQTPLNWAGHWNDTAFFVSPFAAIRLSDGRAIWTAPGCCALLHVADDIQAITRDGRVELIGKDGGVLKSWPGELLAAGAGGVVVMNRDAGAVTYSGYFVSDGETRSLDLRAKPALGGMTIDGGSLFYVDETGRVWEYNVARGTPLVAYRPQHARSTATDVFVPPVVVGDRMYVDDGGWVALDRRPSRSPIRDTFSPR